MDESKFIAVDFDGTCVTHEYPRVGRDVGAVPVLRKIAHTHKLILWTMRSGPELDAAVEWFAKNGIPLWSANCNPEQTKWTSSPKSYADLYIDDTALGAPLKKGGSGEKDYMNWEEVERMLVGRGII
ncbi:MAG: hypothetical protein FWC23_10275 [Chitinispirillia bacterium]|nr:hypothetical protein [Chitinispirillia bacterium]MCL2269554.1 hypothetical protein [Chitinispirillia bacterium]